MNFKTNEFDKHFRVKMSILPWFVDTQYHSELATPAHQAADVRHASTAQHANCEAVRAGVGFNHGDPP